MKNLKSNIEELRKILNEDNFKKDEAIEFLEAIEIDVDGLIDELDDANTEITSLESKIDDLKEEVNELEGTDTNSEIECGIGTIEYNEPDNLLLQDVMDNLSSAIKKHTPKKVNEVLSAIS